MFTITRTFEMGYGRMFGVVLTNYTDMWRFALSFWFFELVWCIPKKQ